MCTSCIICCQATQTVQIVHMLKLWLVSKSFVLPLHRTQNCYGRTSRGTARTDVFILYFYGSTALVGLDLLYEFLRSHSDTPHSVGLLWTSDQPDAKTSTWQRTLPTRDKHPCLFRDLDPQSQQAIICKPMPETARSPVSAVYIIGPQKVHVKLAYSSCRLVVLLLIAFS
jgi:hypothetical protein